MCPPLNKLLKASGRVCFLHACDRWSGLHLIWTKQSLSGVKLLNFFLKSRYLLRGAQWGKYFRMSFFFKTLLLAWGGVGGRRRSSLQVKNELSTLVVVFDGDANEILASKWNASLSKLLLVGETSTMLTILDEIDGCHWRRRQQLRADSAYRMCLKKVLLFFSI